MFHNATCGWIQWKQGNVSNAQYCILKDKKRKFTQTLTHIQIHKHFSYSEKSGVNLGKQLYDDGISITFKSPVRDCPRRFSNWFFQTTCSFHTDSIITHYVIIIYKSETLWGRGLQLSTFNFIYSLRPINWYMRYKNNIIFYICTNWLEVHI